MYKVSHYTEANHQEILSFIRENDFATVAGMGIEYPVASHLPLKITEIDNQLFFTGHLMRKTDHHVAFEKNDQVLVLFQSPHAYINADWYENPAQPSTVNYMAVHAQGIISFLDDAGTLNAIQQLTDKHIGTESLASFNNIPKEDVAHMLKAIVGFKIEVTSLQHVFKLSQNKSTADQQSIIDNLIKRQHQGDTFIAHQMKVRI